MSGTDIVCTCAFAVRCPVLAQGTAAMRYSVLVWTMLIHSLASYYYYYYYAKSGTDTGYVLQGGGASTADGRV
eukprot:3367848-Rhodomonas_salina.1